MNIRELMRPHLQKVNPYVPGKPVEELRREKNIGGEIIKLASNENPYEPMDEIRRAIIDEIPLLDRYPDSSCHYLTSELAEFYGLSREQVFVGNGSNEILELLVKAFVNPEEEVIYPFPSFIAYPLICQQSAVTDKKIPLKDFTVDLKAIKDAVTPATKMIFICNPNNPTGTYVGGEAVDDFINGLRRDIIVVFDEAYFEYVTAPDFPDTYRLLREYKNVILLRTFSKVFSLAGVRIGYSLSHAELASCLHLVRQPFNVNSIAQTAARAALRHFDKLKMRIEENTRERESIADELKAMGFTVPPSQTNFLLVVPRAEGNNLVSRMEDRGVIVRGMAPFGLGGDSFRVSIGTVAENRRFIQTLREVTA